MISLAVAVNQFVENCDAGSIRRALASLAFAALLYARTILPLTSLHCDDTFPRRARFNECDFDE